MKRMFRTIIVLTICISMVIFPVDLGYADENGPIELSVHIGSSEVITIDCTGLEQPENPCIRISGYAAEVEWLRTVPDTDRSDEFRINAVSVGNTGVVFFNPITDEVYAEYDITVTGHDYEVTDVTEADCQNHAVTTYTCSICGDSYTQESSELGDHVYGEWQVTQEPTCTESGSRERSCSVCGSNESEEIAPLGHELMKVDAKEATETEEGNIEYWVCDRCGKYFADSEGNTEISPESVVIPVTEPVSGVSWTLENGVLTISGTGPMDDYASASEAPWYKQRADITKVVIAEGVTAIGARAFYQYTNLTEVEISSTVEKIGARAFYADASLSEIVIPAAVTELGDSSFRACSSLKKITFGGNAPKLGTYVFTDASTDLTIHCYENTTGWDGEEWSGLNVSVDHKLGEVTIVKEPTCTEEGEGQAVCLICGETIIEYIPALGHDYVNGYCTICGDREIVSSGNCGESNYTYTMGSNVRYVLYGDGELVISGRGNMHHDWDVGYHKTPWYGLNVKSVVIEDGVTNIGKYAFYNCSKLTSITIPEGVTVIEKGAFHGCSSLTSIIIPESVTTIGDGTFSFCSGLTSIIIPESVKVIGGGTFSNCSGLTSIIIPESVTAIGDRTFSYCSGLTSIIIPESVTSIEGWAFEGCSSLTSITIPESVTSIGSGTFNGCSTLTSIMIPESVTTIGDGTFSFCSGLTSITIPESVTSIGKSAFYNCRSITSLIIPESVTSIGQSAFEYCSSLTSITIPESVTSIGDNAFSNCSKLTSIYVINGSYADTCFSSDKIKYVYKLDEHYYHDEIINNPTCSSNGLKQTICVICGNILNTETIDIDPDAHTWGAWSESVAPDCIHEGE